MIGTVSIHGEVSMLYVDGDRLQRPKRVKA